MHGGHGGQRSRRPKPSGLHLYCTACKVHTAWLRCGGAVSAAEYQSHSSFGLGQLHAVNHRHGDHACPFASQHAHRVGASNLRPCRCPTTVSTHGITACAHAWARAGIQSCTLHLLQHHTPARVATSLAAPAHGALLSQPHGMVLKGHLTRWLFGNMLEPSSACTGQYHGPCSCMDTYIFIGCARACSAAFDRSGGAVVVCAAATRGMSLCMAGFM